MTVIARKNPMRSVPDWRITMPLAHASPRCGSRTRAGTPCRQAAMGNGRCRMHGGLSTGPRTAEGLERIRKARTRAGLHSAEMLEMRRWSAALRKQARWLMERF
jgi:hypothetical protein